MISAILAQELQARRADCNARFRLAAQRYPQLDGAELLRFMTDCVDPLIRAVHERVPAKVGEVLEVAYDCALQLTGQRLTLEAGRYRVIAAIWRELLPAAASVVAEASSKVIPSLTNAAHQLASRDASSALRWKMRLLRIVPVCELAEECLLAGQVIAWQCGLAHYRDGALAALHALPARLASLVLQVDPQQLPATLQRLHADPWFDPAHASSSAMRVVRYVGAFRGFGGAFLQPPLVRSAAGGWLVQSGTDYWVLIADAFGATLHRASDAEWRAAHHSALEHHGTCLVHGTQSLQIEGAGAITSSASNGAAAACTFAHSHRIALVAGRST
jgi:hypothetical protein